MEITPTPGVVMPPAHESGRLWEVASPGSQVEVGTPYWIEKDPDAGLDNRTWHYYPTGFSTEFDVPNYDTYHVLAPASEPGPVDITVPILAQAMYEVYQPNPLNHEWNGAAVPWRQSYLSRAQAIRAKFTGSNFEEQIACDWYHNNSAMPTDWAEASDAWRIAAGQVADKVVLRAIQLVIA